MTIRLTASTTCFHYGVDGLRCGAPCLDPALFCCATHLHDYLRAPAADLLKAAAEALADSTRFSQEGLPELACMRLSSWRTLSNTLRALTHKGYHDTSELLSALVGALESIQRPFGGFRAGPFRKGKPFERLVARLYLEELAPFTESAATGDHLTDTVRVVWDQTLPSKAEHTRQIDVLLRWRHSTGETLTIVECKDREVEVSDMDAFATVIRHTGAAHGVMVSSIGFQSGADDCARLEGIETRVVNEGDFAPALVERAVTLNAFEPVQIVLDPAPGEKTLPSLATPHRLIQVLKDGVISSTLHEYIQELVGSEPPSPGTMPPRVDVATPDLRLLFPDGHALSIAAIHITLRVVERQTRCTLPLPRRPLSFAVFQRPVGRERRVGANEVPLLSPRELAADRFYTNLMGQTYYCESVDAGAAEARLVLLADYQHSERLDAELTVSLDQSEHYYSIEDTDALAKLQAELALFRGFARTSAPKA